MAREIVGWLSFALIAFLAVLTIRVMIDDGVDFLTLISLFLLVILGFGVLGALWSRDD